MVGVALHNFDGSAFDVASQIEENGVVTPSVDVLIDGLYSEGRVLTVVEKRGYSSETYEVPFKTNLRTAMQSLIYIAPLFIVSELQDEYSSVFCCCTTPDDPDLAFLEREEVDVMDTRAAKSMLEAAGEDPALLDQVLAAAYAYKYEEVLGQIRTSLMAGLSGDGDILTFLTDPKVKPVLIGNVEPLLFGFVGKPGKIERRHRLENFGDIGRQVASLLDTYPGYRAQDRHMLDTLARTWRGIAGSFNGAFWECYPDKPRDEMITADEIIAAACLDGAKEAYEAGVPIEDIFC